VLPLDTDCSDAESRCQALETQFGVANDSTAYSKDAIDLQQQLIQAQKRISNYEALMGSEETKALVEQLEAKEKQIRALELINKNREQVRVDCLSGFSVVDCGRRGRVLYIPSSISFPPLGRALIAK